MEDVPLHLTRAVPSLTYATSRAWSAVNYSFRRYVLARLAAAGPLLSKAIPDTSAVQWPATGWTNNGNETQMLELLALKGEVAVSGRVGRQCTLDLTVLIYPADLPAVV